MILKKLQHVSVVLVMLAMAPNTFAQNSPNNNVGIGTITPEPAAILHIESPQSPDTVQGVLLPRLNFIEINQIENQYSGEVPDGLLVYNEDDGEFWYYKYDDPVPSIPPYGQWSIVQTQTQAQNTNVPEGGIIMWSGTIASIPTGWALCNGLNNTPDLTDKFIISVASAAENPGTAPVNGFFVDVEAGSVVAPDRRFFKLAYIMKLP